MEKIFLRFSRYRHEKGWELSQKIAQKSNNMFEKSGLANITIYDEAF